MKRHSLLLGFIFLIGFNSFCQVSDSLFELFCIHEDIVILEENKTITFNGKSINNNTNSFFTNVQVESECILTIKTEAGLKEFSPFILPKSFDEAFIPHTTSIHKSTAIFDEIELLDFEACKMTNDRIGHSIEIVRKYNTCKKVYGKGFFGSGFNCFKDGYMGSAQYYSIHFENVKVGDTVKVIYQYKTKYSTNKPQFSSNRIFFYGKYPKKHFQLIWKHCKKLGADSFFIHDKPERNEDENYFIFQWNMKNLPGALDEPCSRPFYDLSSFVYVPRLGRFSYGHVQASALVGSFAYSGTLKDYNFMVNNRENDFLKLIWDKIIGLKNREQNNFQQFADRIALNQESDSSGITVMRKFQQYMVEEVEYSNAINYYNQYNKRQTPATDLLNLKISDYLISEVYANMVLKFGLNFFTSYPMDKRSGVLFSAYFPTVYDNNVLFVVLLKDGSRGFLLPKSEVNNFYFNELPFYFEDIPLLLNQPYDLLNDADLEEKVYLFEELYDTTLIPTYRECRTPRSSLKDNYRKTQSLVHIELSDEQCTFNTKLYLSGQYSTLTRAVYMDRPIDSTINLRYFKPIWHVAEDVVLESVKTVPPLIYFPFKTSVVMSYSSKEVLHQENTNFSIELNDLLKPVFYEENLPSIRFTDFYSDFKGSDSYSYMLEFDSSVVIISKPANVEIENDYAKLEFQLDQLGENKLLLVCNFYTKAKKVDVENYRWVVEFNTAIKNILNSSIVFK